MVRVTLFGLMAVSFLLLSNPAMAQTTGGVFPPNVNEGHRSIQYRGGYNPDTDVYAQRLHYQAALNGDFMLRGLVQARTEDDSSIEVDFVQAELFWDLSEDTDKWRTGVRFDARIRTEGRPGQIGFNWMNRWSLSEDWESRFLVLTSANVGDGASGGVALQTRGALNYSGFKGVGVGLEVFSAYGTTDDFADSFDEQRHAIGPTLNLKITPTISLFGGPLFGLTDATPDQDYRIWITQSF